MNQSSYIAAALILGFVLYLAAKNRLTTYLAVLWGSTAKPLPAPNVSTSSGQASGNATDSGSILNLLENMGGSSSGGSSSTASDAATAYEAYAAYAAYAA